MFLKFHKVAKLPGVTRSARSSGIVDTFSVFRQGVFGIFKYSRGVFRMRTYAAFFWNSLCDQDN